LLKLAFDDQLAAIKITPFLGMLIDGINDLLSIFESVLSRSSKDVFPFYLKDVELYHQLSKLLLTVDSRLELVNKLASCPDLSLQFSIDALEELSRIAREIVTNSDISAMVRELEQIFTAYQEVRAMLGQEEKSGAEIKQDVQVFLESLKYDESMLNAYKIMEKRFRMYDAELYISYDNKFVPRTNNDLEDFNNCLKRPIRKGQGKRESWFYVEHQGASVAYYHNMLHAPHVVGGAEISFGPEKTPLERIGVLEKISVTGIMSMIDRDCFYKNLLRNDALYTVHRWTRRIFKHGLDACLSSLDSKWTSLYFTFQHESVGEIIKGGKPSLS
jgi:hypothetical protein